MTTSIILNLETMLSSGKDSALLRFSLGSEYLKNGNPDVAVTHLSQATAYDANYSAAWKLLGKALTECGRLQDALQTYQRGIEVANRRGDKQAAKEMMVFSKRIEKQLGS